MNSVSDASVSFVLVGGFLGSGKTTSLVNFGKWLCRERGIRVAMITNDQATRLVDTEIAMNASIPTREISGGCFCCRSGLLIEETERLINDVDPDIILAEPVGSCTDLVSTVLLPFRTVYNKQYRIAPLSVLLDPYRAERTLQRIAQSSKNGDVLGGNADNVDYIYLKQLEEAELIVINKIDVIGPAGLLT